MDRLPDLPILSNDENVCAGTNDNIQPGPSRQLRSSDLPYDVETHCVICCVGEEKEEIHKVTSFNVHEQLKQMAQTDYSLLTRLNNALDSIAEDIQYHSTCILKKGRVSARPYQSH